MDKDMIIESLMKQVADLTALVQTLTESNAALNETIKELQETIRELQRQLNQNSQNSSKPPSSDGFNKPNPQSQRQKSGKKQGAQKGHPGSHMVIPHEPDECSKHFPQKCLSCSHLNECVMSGKVFTCGERRYEVNAVITTKVTEHQSIHVAACPCTGGPLSGEFPEGIRAYVQYGDSVSVLAGLLSTYGAVSTMRIHVLLGSLLGVSLSTGTITSMVSKCAQKVGDTLQTIKSMLIGAKVAHFDETGTDVNGKIIWVHNSSTPDLTYQTINAKRGQIGMEDNGVLPEFKTLLRSMKKARDKAIAKGKTELSYYYLHKFDTEYDRLMKLADEECPLPPDPPQKKKGRKKKGKERSLIERLMALKASVCLFIRNFDVPFDNNQAERDVRNVKTKTKVSGCFRTESGAQDYLDIMSYIGTGKKHGVSAYEALTAAFAGNAQIVLK